MQTISNKWIICRICLRTSEGAMLPIFGDDIMSNLAAQIADYGSIELINSKTYPNWICESCLLLLKAAKKFRKLSQTSAMQLQELVMKFNVKTKNSESSEPCTDQITAEFLRTESEKSLEMVEEQEKDVENTTGIGYVFEIIGNDEDDCVEVADGSMLAPHDAQFIELEDDDGAMDFLEDNSTGNSVELAYYSNSQFDDLNEETFVSDVQSSNIKLFEDEQQLENLKSKSKQPPNQPETPPQECDPESISFIGKPIKKRTADGRKKYQRYKAKDKEDSQSDWIKKGTNNYVCSYCGNCYKEKSKLTLHLRIHTKEKPHECEICHKRFAQTPQLARHMNSHTGNRPFECKFCDASFADPSTCIKHQRIHTQERPYVCETCGKAFSYSNVLKVHIMSHTGEKPYNCKYCDKKFTQSHHRRTHERTHL